MLLLQVIDFYEYYEGLQEGWDGPALLVFSDGNKIGARLDRNGLRPARFWETDDGMVYVASEVGVLGDVLSNASHVVRKGRLGPGQMVCADLADVSPLPPDLLTRDHQAGLHRMTGVFKAVCWHPICLLYTTSCFLYHNHLPSSPYQARSLPGSLCELCASVQPVENWG